MSAVRRRSCGDGQGVGQRTGMHAPRGDVLRLCIAVHHVHGQLDSSGSASEGLGKIGGDEDLLLPLRLLLCARLKTTRRYFPHR